MKNTTTTSRSYPANSPWCFRPRPPASSIRATRGFRARWRLPGNRDFAPRIGLAYSPDVGQDSFLGKIVGGPGKTSIRAGFGIFYAAIQGETLGLISDNAPYGFTYTSPAPPLFTTPFVDAATGNVEGQRFPAQLAPLNASPSQSGPQHRLLPIRADQRDTRAIRPPTRFPTPSRTCCLCSGRSGTIRCSA